MHICLITCFYGRHEKVERVIKCFLNQTYTGPLTLLLYNNSHIPQVLDDFKLPDNKRIILINNNKDLVASSEYSNVGDIFRDAVTFVPSDAKVISFFDSDDIYLPEHVEYGAKGMKTAYNQDYLAYKPYFSYYIHDNMQMDKCHNNMEPSIFVDKGFIEKNGFNSVNSSYHQKWLDKLYKEDLIFSPIFGTPTFLYCWEAGHNTHKISGLGDSPDNFYSHRKFETDHGDGVLSPSYPYELDPYYKLVETLLSPTDG